MAIFINDNKSSSPSFSNQNKTSSGTLGGLTPNDIGNLLPTDILPGTIPAITLGDANPNTVIYTVFTNNSKSASPTWSNQNKS